MRRTGSRLFVTLGFAALMLLGGPAFASQPTNVANSQGRPEPAPLDAGPHCHIALRAGGGNFDMIVTATRHHAHLRTPEGVFSALVPCPAAK